VKPPFPKPRTVERCEAYLDKLADLIVEAGDDWTVDQPLVERLERECRRAKEELSMRERMLNRSHVRKSSSLSSPLPKTAKLVNPSHPGALTLKEIWALAAPHNAALDPADRHRLIMLCRDRMIVRHCKEDAKSVVFVR